MIARKRYHWDFFGPLALEKAKHFSSHLEERLSTESITDCVIGSETANPGHHGVFVVPPASAQAFVERELRPNRVTTAD